MTHRSLAIACLLLSGCSALSKLGFGSSGSGATAAGASGHARPPGSNAPINEAAPAPGAATELVTYYQGLHYRDMPRLVGPKGSDLSKAGVTDKMMAKSASPDTRWIPGWDMMDRGTRHYALLEAAIGRTWWSDCRQDYARFTKAWDSIREALHEDIDFVRETGDFYAGASRLRTVWPKLEELAAQRNANLNHALNLSMVRAELAQAELELRKRTGRQRLARYVAHSEVLTYWRPMPSQPEVAETLYCTLAAASGTFGLPEAPELRDAKRVPDGAVRPMLDPVHDEAIEVWNKSSGHWPPPGEADVSTAPITSYETKAGDLVYVDDGTGFRAAFVVKAINETNEGTVVKLKWSRTAQEKYACRPTDRVARVEADGRVEYFEKCKLRDVKYEYHVVATFADPLPPDLKVGDQLGLYATIESIDRSNKLSGNVRRRTIKAKVRGVHVREIQRAGKTISKW